MVDLFQPALPHYRLPIFLALAGQAGLDLTVHYGQVKDLSNAPAVGFQARPSAQWRFSLWGEELVLDPGWLALAWSARGRVQLFPWDLRHVLLVPALVLARLRGNGTVLWGHGYSKRRSLWRRLLRDAVGRLADAVLLYNHAAASRLAEGGLDPARVFVAPNTMDQTDIQAARARCLERPQRLPEFRAANGVPGGPIVLFCSRLEKANGVEALIRAHALLLARRPDARLVIIGQGPDQLRLRRLTLRLKLQERVLFLGAVYGQRELAPWFLAASVFCYPTNIGLSLLHAFGYGLPVVTSDKLDAQNPEIEALHDGKNGLLYRDGDVADLAAVLERILDDPALGRRLGAEARRTALEDYPVANMVRGLHDALLAAAPAPAPRPASPPVGRAGGLAVLVERQGPYHRARFKALGARARLQCLEVFRKDRTYQWEAVPGRGGYAVTTLFKEEAGIRPGVLLSRVHAALGAARPAVVAIPGWADRASLAALLWCLEQGVPAVLMADSSAGDHRRWAPLEWMKSRVVSHFDAALVSGSRASQYLRGLGLSPDLIQLGYDAVDNAHFHRGAEAARRDAAGMRRQLGLPAEYFLACSRFTTKKNLAGLLRSYARYAGAARKPWELVVLGDGPCAPALKAQAQALGISPLVSLPGFIQYPDLPAYHGLAGAFVLASTSEQWGLVVNEAMAAGLPVLVSDRCGCAPDLVEPGGNGFVFDPGDEGDLARRMGEVSRDRPARAAMAARSRRIIRRWSTGRFARGLLAASDLATARRSARRHGWLSRALLTALIYRPLYSHGEEQ